MSYQMYMVERIFLHELYFTVSKLLILTISGASGYYTGYKCNCETSRDFSCLCIDRTGGAVTL